MWVSAWMSWKITFPFTPKDTKLHMLELCIGAHYNNGSNYWNAKYTEFYFQVSYK